ncbi:MAG: ATP-binding protein, partial [Selenomonadaceae bacterium]|nr:ATP-binding protein [Selenomonadaceae bacterium]
MGLENLIVCRNLLKDEIINQTADDFETIAKMIERAEILGLSGNILRNYLIYKLAHEPNLISETVEKNGGTIGESLYNAFIHDIKNLSEILNSPAKFNFLADYKPTVQNKIESLAELESKLENLRDAEEIAAAFIEHYKKFGYGDIAAYRAFRWENQLIGIKHFEKILLEDLIGYAHQKELLTKNTIAFLEGKPANNVLLVGARGTGKSSGVKALVNEYYTRGLRLVQITKLQLKNLPEIMDALRKFASKRFIIFLDDLSFEESETEYKYLKSSIEGGVESRPENVLLYATSNRRHLIRETWRDRDDRQDELYRDDSVNETISLSDRFGLIIHYSAPTQAEYLEIIRHMLKKKNISLDEETLRIEGLRWEMSHSGRNGRTAQQF